MTFRNIVRQNDNQNQGDGGVTQVTNYSYMIMFMVGLKMTMSPALADSFSCPKPSEQTGNNIKGDVSGEAQTLLKLGSAELKGNVDKIVVDLYSKYPNADRVAIASDLLSTTCYLIRDSQQLSDSDKLDKWYKVFPLIQSIINQETVDQKK
jgi:hypothetical protein